jgi:hypothetical protein
MGQNINAQEYLTVLQDVVKPLMDRVTNECHYIFQQGGAPAHNVKGTQD